MSESRLSVFGARGFYVLVGTSITVIVMVDHLKKTTRALIVDSIVDIIHSIKIVGISSMSILTNFNENNYFISCQSSNHLKK